MAYPPRKSPARTLLLDSVLRVIPVLGSTSDDSDPMIHVKWFTPDANFTWYVAEYDPESQIGYGFVVAQFPEWGTFDVAEIAAIRGSLGLPVERDLHFTPCRFSEVRINHPLL